MKPILLKKTVAAVALILLGSADAASAAALRITGPAAAPCEGATFAVQVRLDSPSEAINTARVLLSYDAASLEMTGISTAGSIFRFWAEGPEFNSGTGSVLMTGGLPTPGYQGSNGLVATLVMKTKTAAGGSVTVLPDSEVLLNDGYGTPTSLTTSGLTITALPGTAPSCVTVTPTPGPATTPGPGGTPGPTPTPFVCPTPEAPVCQISEPAGPEGTPKPSLVRECPVTIRCGSDSRTVMMFVPEDAVTPFSCPLTTFCAPELLGPSGQGNLAERVISAPGRVITRVRQDSAAFWPGLLLGMLIALLAWGLHKLWLRHKKKGSVSTSIPGKP